VGPVSDFRSQNADFLPEKPSRFFIPNRLNQDVRLFLNNIPPFKRSGTKLISFIFHILHYLIMMGNQDFLEMLKKQNFYDIKTYV